MMTFKTWPTPANALQNMPGEMFCTSARIALAMARKHRVRKRQQAPKDHIRWRLFAH
jgi:hypothetical protein